MPSITRAGFQEGVFIYRDKGHSSSVDAVRALRGSLISLCDVLLERRRDVGPIVQEGKIVLKSDPE